MRVSVQLRIFFFFNDTAATEIYTLSLHDALPILISAVFIACWNLVSVFAEYGLLLRIYHRVPTLGVKVKPSAGMVRTTCFKDS